jgi:hypothetical protein
VQREQERKGGFSVLRDGALNVGPAEAGIKPGSAASSNSQYSAKAA